MRNLFVHYYVWSFECLFFLTTNRLRFRTDCSAHCVIKSFFYFLGFYSVYVQQFVASLSFYSEPKFLGVTLDRELTFRRHLESLRKKLTSLVALLRDLLVLAGVLEQQRCE